MREVTERAGEVIGGLRAMIKRDGAAAGLTSVDVNHVIRVIERVTHGDANLHNVAVHLDLSPDVRPVRGDSVQLQQVILNLWSTPSAPWTERPTAWGAWSCARIWLTARTC